MNTPRTSAHILELKRILHVEDDESISVITRLSLNMIGGYEVLSCDSGAMAIERAADFDPDLLLIDVMMPGMDGPTTLAGLGERLDLSRLPVIFMTAKTEPDDHRSYYALGVNAVIVKPFDPMSLAAEIRAVWERFHD